LAIDVGRDIVMVKGASSAWNPWAPEAVDTFRVDGKVVRWLAGQRGISRSPLATKEPDLHPGQRVLSTRGALWPGESWTLSSDGKALLHMYQWTRRDSTYRLTWTYRRSAG
jgi:hypothetical protein